MRRRYVYYHFTKDYLLLLDKEWHELFEYSELKPNAVYLGVL